MGKYFLLALLTACLPGLAVADSLPACDGDTIPICQDGAGRVHIYAPITVHGTLNYFGTDASDTVKLSSQGIGNGGVVLATDSTTQDYRPLNLRGEGITGQYKIEDPNGYPGTTWSQMSLPGFKLEPWTGEFRVYKNLRIDNAIDFSQSAYAYFRGNAAHGYRFNDSADAQNLAILNDSGSWWWKNYAGTGTRYLTVDSSGNIVPGGVVP